MDGERGTHRRNALGEATVGPLGLLTFLETQLGLLAPAASAAERVVAYRRCLAAYLEPSRFYARSFAIDELGTAATLLGWRDRWYLDGWTGAPTPVGAPRLDDLATVERSAAAEVPPGIGQRLTAVLDRLERRRVAIDEIQLLDSRERFPQRWRAVLERLPCREAETPTPRGRGFLRELQTQLLATLGSRTPTRIPWRDDGTVRIARADTRLVAAHWLAATLREEPRDTLLVAADSTTLLDGVLSGSGLAAQGFGELSPFRPALQVLRLALRTLWTPLDFQALLQMLTAPIGPLPPAVRRRLAETLAERPGLGGERWHKALVDLETRAGARGAEERAAINAWIEPERHDRRAGAPITAVAARARMVEEFFQGRLGEEDPVLRDAYQAGFSQAATAVRAFRELEAQGATRLKPAQVDAVLDRVTGHGNADPLRVAEVGACAAVAEPGAVVEPFDRVAWWSPALPPVPRRDPWSAHEIEALAASGVHVAPPAERLAADTTDGMKPVLAARDELVIVLPPPVVDVHPIWLWIDSLVDGLPVRRIESVLEARATGTAIETLPVRRLPRRRRWWQLADPALIRRPEQTSYSGLERLLSHPAQWLLGDVARFRRSRILDLPDPFQLKGNLAHALVERLYRDAGAPALGNARVASWFDRHFDRLVGEEGALLTVPGQRAELERFRLTLRSALARLHRQLRAAQVDAVTPEQPLDGHFDGGALRGVADLVVRRSDAATGLVDLKWSGGRKYREKLENNEHLQLGVYGELLRQRIHAWPAVAYFVVDAGLLYAQNSHYFPDADTVRTRTLEDTSDVWRRALVSWQWRIGQIERGAIEVPVDGTEATAESEPPAEGLPGVAPDERYDEFRYLYGWSAQR